MYNLSLPFSNSLTLILFYIKASNTISFFALNVMRMLLGIHIHTSLVYTVTTISNFTPTKEQMGQKLPNDSRQCFYWSFKAKSLIPCLLPDWLQMILGNIKVSGLCNASCIKKYDAISFKHYDSTKRFFLIH